MELKYKYGTLYNQKQKEKDILRKIKEERKLDHRQIIEHSMSHKSQLIMEKRRRERILEAKLQDMRSDKYKFKKSKIYLKVMKEDKNNSVTKMKKRGKLLNDAKKKYSDLVKEFFPKSKQKVEGKKLLSPSEKARKKRIRDYQNSHKRYNLGNQYLDQVREMNKDVPKERRKFVMKEEKPKELIKKPKVLERLRQENILPHDSQTKTKMRKNLLKKFATRDSSDSKNYVMGLVNNLDEDLKRKEMRIKYKADRFNRDEDLEEAYLNSITTKLELLEREVEKQNRVERKEKKKEEEWKRQYHDTTMIREEEYDEVMKMKEKNIRQMKKKRKKKGNRGGLVRNEKGVDVADFETGGLDKGVNTTNFGAETTEKGINTSSFRNSNSNSNVGKINVEENSKNKLENINEEDEEF